MNAAFPPFGKEARVSPMPKSVCVAGGRVRTLASAATGAVLTDLDASSFAVGRQVRGLPSIHRLLLNLDGFSLGYTQRQAKGNPSELHFVDPDLRVVHTALPVDACTSFAAHGGHWVVACRDGGIHCFSSAGVHLWTWEVPRDRHFESPIFEVVAGGDLVFASEGLYLYAITERGHLLWDWELPHHHEQTHRMQLGTGGVESNHKALATLGLTASAGPVEVRQAYRRMARLTHPDFNPGDSLAAERFRAVRSAYESLSAAGAQDPTEGGIEVVFSLMINGRPVTATITAVAASDNLIALGTSEREAYLCDFNGDMLAYHQRLGTQPVQSVLLKPGGFDAVYCYPHIHLFRDGGLASSDHVPEYGELIPHGDDKLLCGRKTMWLLDRDAKFVGSTTIGRKIDGACASRGESVVLAGRLFSLPHR